MKESLCIEDLLPMRCSTPGCAHCDEQLYFGSDCHPGANLQVIFDKSDGVLTLLCGECDGFICNLRIAHVAKEKMT